MDTLRQIKDWLTQRAAPNWESIALDDTGFTSGSQRVNWSQINSVSAYKRDMITFDEVWFQLETDQGIIRICEEQPGFDKWESMLCKVIPTVANWRDSVIQPAFAENFSILYRRT